MSFGSRGVQINLSGSNLDVLEQTANEVKEVMQEFDGIDSVSTSLSDGDPRAQIVVDSVQALSLIHIWCAKRAVSCGKRLSVLLCGCIAKRPSHPSQHISIT